MEIDRRDKKFENFQTLRITLERELCPSLMVTKLFARKFKIDATVGSLLA